MVYHPSTKKRQSHTSPEVAWFTTPVQKSDNHTQVLKLHGLPPRYEKRQSHTSPEVAWFTTPVQKSDNHTQVLKLHGLPPRYEKRQSNTSPEVAWFTTPVQKSDNHTQVLKLHGLPTRYEKRQSRASPEVAWFTTPVGKATISHKSWSCMVFIQIFKKKKKGTYKHTRLWTNESQLFKRTTQNMHRYFMVNPFFKQQT